MIPRALPLILASLVSSPAAAALLPWYPVVDTGQDACYGNTVPIPCPSSGAFHGQDSQFAGLAPSYLDNGDGTVTDLVTGLMWQKDYVSDISWNEAMAGEASFNLAGYTDWHVPTIKELYSLIDFGGVFGSTTDSTQSIPFIDRNYFTFSYAPVVGTTRYFDVQEWSRTAYIGETMDFDGTGGDSTVFGVNFADGRIKGYPKASTPGGSTPSRKFVRYVRQSLPNNSFIKVPGTHTIIDRSTGLMWSEFDSGEGMTWQEALAWVDDRNAESYEGYDDWRLPNIKELQSIVDYTRAPDSRIPARVGPAIAPVFAISALGDDYPYFWSSTTEADGPVSERYSRAAYIAFGLAKGWMQDLPDTTHVLVNTHGAGAQRAEPKSGDPAGYPFGWGPQGDVVRIENYVRLVRGASQNLVGVPATPRGGLALRVTPNPAIDGALVEFAQPVAGRVEVAVFGVGGRRVRTLVEGSFSAGLHRVWWDGRDGSGRLAPAGMYFVRTYGSRGVESRKLLLAR
jgi:hypothetical protein